MYLSKSQKGLSMIELIMVIFISGLLIYSIGASILNLQSYVRLENILRKMKSEIIAAQVSARTNFIPRNANEALDFKISLGWIVSFLPQSNDNIRLIRRSVYIRPFNNNSYNFDNLTQDIIRFKNIIKDNVGFTCEGNLFMMYRGPGNKTNVFSSVQPNVNFDVFCADNKLNFNDDYFESIFEKISIDTNITQNQIPSCIDQNSSLGRNSIFFGVGYGEQIIPNNLNNCQIKIANMQQQIIQHVRGLYIGQGVVNIRICSSACYF